jgi:hypothetical protein
MFLKRVDGRRSHAKHTTKPRYEKDGVNGLREPKSHAIHNPQTIDPTIKRRIIELRREHPDWKKVVAIAVLRQVEKVAS